MQRVASRERVSRRVSGRATPRRVRGLVRMASRWLAAVAPIFALGADAADESIDLRTYEIATGQAQRQVVVTGFLLGDRVADIAVISSDESGRCRLRVFAGEASWQLQIDAPLPSAIELVDVAHIGDRDRLLIYRRGQLTWFNPEQTAERPLLSAVVRYRQLLPNRVSHVDVARDVTGDGRDDLLLPDRDAFQVFVQRRDGSFAEPVTIGPSPGFRRLYEVNGYRYDPWAQGRVYELDYNHDGRPDLAYWNDDHFAVHLQRASEPDVAGLDGYFSSRAETFAATVPFDADELAYFAAGTWDFDDASELQGRVFDGFADFDNDGTADLAIATVAGDSLFAKHTTFEVHFGKPTTDGSATTFGELPDTSIVSDGMQLGMARHDLDDDGQVDLMFTVFDPSPPGVVFDLLGSFLLRRMSFDLEFFRLANGAYPNKPDALRKLRVKSPHGEPPGGLASALRSRPAGTPPAPRPPYPSALLGDINGDGKAELLLQRGFDELQIFMGVAAPGLFARKPRKLPFSLPPDQEFVWLTDLNRDGKADLLAHHWQPAQSAQTKQPAANASVTLLVAQ